MKRILLILVLLATTIAQSQEKIFEKEVVKISKKIEKITQQQKDSLKQKVKDIDKQLQNGKITETKADLLKKEAATYHAKQIEKLVGEQEQLLQQLVQDKANGNIASDNYFEEENTFTIGSKTFRLGIKENEDFEENKKRKTKKRKQRATTTQFVFAMGVNNVLNDNQFSSLDNSEYQFWRSRFYELGWTWKTRLTREASQFYFKYGVSFLWNNLRLKDNQQHVKNGEFTTIETRIDEELTESRLRHVQMIFPMHLEWDLSKNRKYSDGTTGDRRNRSIRFGLGGFFGFKLGTRQYLEYRDLDNVEVEEVQFDNFNMNTFNYGISSYFGYKSTSLYVKYDLNPLFQNTETRNISMGIRFDFD